VHYVGTMHYELLKKYAQHHIYWLSISMLKLSVSILCPRAVFASTVSLKCMERLRQPIRGKFTQDQIYSHLLFKWQGPFKWQGQGSHWARPWPTGMCGCRTGDCQSLASLTGTITHSPPVWIAQNGAVVPAWNQRQLAQNVRVGNNIYHRLWGWQVHHDELGSNLALAVLGQES
jgi:hypothetical protein